MLYFISDPNYQIIEAPNKSSPGGSPLTGYSSTPMNMSALSWRSNVSQNESKLIFLNNISQFNLPIHFRSELLHVVLMELLERDARHERV